MKVIDPSPIRRRYAFSRATFCATLAALLLAGEAKGFSLLGPFADWMLPEIGYRQAGEIGGPMDLNEEYRWNVPLVTYGFDKTFVDFFGSDGVKAVESSIKVLNRVPAASKIVLTNYPTNTRRMNMEAFTQGLYDLKSATLPLLLEQQGLTKPTRNVFTLRRWDPTYFSMFPDEVSWPAGTIPYYVLERNFDPETYQPSHSVNGALYTGRALLVPLNDGSYVPDILEMPIDPLPFGSSAAAKGGFFPGTFSWPAVADAELFPGRYFTGLTRDDVGGLRYLLRKDNINYEPLLSSVRIPGRNDWMQNFPQLDPSGLNPNASRNAFRPGREQITFVRHPFTGKPRRWLPLTYQFTDKYVAQDGDLRTRRVMRTVERPDILFCAADTGENSAWSLLTLRTGTTNWINSSSTNAGPGIISPPIKITFHKLGPEIVSSYSSAPQISNRGWASFGSATNAPVLFPPRAADFTVRLRAYQFSPGSNVPVTNRVFRVDVPLGGLAALQVSSNHIDWTSVCTVTNTGGVAEWHNYENVFPPTYEVFYRVIPQPAD